MRLGTCSVILIAIVTAAAGLWVHAADPGANKAPGPPAKRLVEPPPPPENYNPPEAPDIQDPAFEPEVTITTKGKEIHEEYRLIGKLYMIKVIPASGKPYYLIDDVGNGKFTRSDLEPQFTIPMWLIGSF